jgi:uncharacterized peroxidase-related enzyme
MPHPAPVDPARAPAEARPVLTRIEAAFGLVPNMFRTAAHSPAALEMLWGGFAALGAGRLAPALGEQIAVAVAERNRCHYCLAAHTALGRKAGLSPAQLARAQAGDSDDPATAAALAFAVDLVEQRGQVGPAALERLRAAGFDDGEVVEILAHVALNLFTNYINIAFQVPVDFPQVALRAA